MRWPRFGARLVDALAPSFIVEGPELVRPSTAWRESQAARRGSYPEAVQDEARRTIEYMGFTSDQLRYDCRVQQLYELACGSAVEFGLGTVHSEQIMNRDKGE